MDLSRRHFLAAAAVAGTGRMHLPDRTGSSDPDAAGSTTALQSPPQGFDPWIEVDGNALRQNLSTVARLAGGRPVLAVVKNNAYGLGLAGVASVLEPLEGVLGFAVVKAEAALALREWGVQKPVLLMGVFGDDVGPDLVRNRIDLVLATEDGPERVRRAAQRGGRPPATQLYVDTGMGRMGLPHHRVPALIDSWDLGALGLSGAFMAFTEDPEFDREQLERFRRLSREVASNGVHLGPLHAASSNGVFNFPESHLDLVRPGIALFGAYPSDADRERRIAQLRPAVALRARVVRVERLRAGDSVSYGRSYVADEPTWVATLPVGHTDGYPRSAVGGARVRINERLYPVIGAVSASHTIVELGPEAAVRVGDVATLVGWEDESLHPNAVAEAAGTSVYDVLMHLNPTLPRVLV
ncbi:MAG: alanine racemase [Gemmatimonadetes bacterium]|nr:alanine racemase [Gemmatimonadota bacterium]